MRVHRYEVYVRRSCVPENDRPRREGMLNGYLDVAWSFGSECLEATPGLLDVFGAAHQRVHVEKSKLLSTATQFEDGRSHGSSRSTKIDGVENCAIA